ncbi:MAG: zinc-binding dehydrogenase [Bacteroidota bacterium]
MGTTVRAAYLIKHGKAASAFEVRETQVPSPGPGEIQIQVEAFGLNFADVMARLGMYPDAPKPPGIIGYDVIGTVKAIGEGRSDQLHVGDRVIGLTRFNGYAELVNTQAAGVVKIEEDIDVASATALATQGGTAHYMAEEMVRLHEGDRVLVHAAAGGVGSLLCQMGIAAGAEVYGTASAAAKLDYLSTIGVHHPINYREKDFAKEASEMDVIFDPIGGLSVKKGFKSLRSGGRMVLFGASSLTSAKSIFSKLGVVLGFGLYSPIQLLNPSKSLIAVNMLRIADDRPDVLNRCLRGAVEMHAKGVITPLSGGVYPIEELAEAHEALEQRQTMGKLAITW